MRSNFRITKTAATSCRPVFPDFRNGVSFVEADEWIVAREQTVAGSGHRMFGFDSPFDQLSVRRVAEVIE